MEQLLASCPKCGGNHLFYNKYQVTLAILKERAWLSCKDCGFETEMLEFKKRLFSV